MCETCGCSSGAKATVWNLQTGQLIALESGQPSEHTHEHEHIAADGTRIRHSHSHEPGHFHGPHAHPDLPGPLSLLSLEARVLAKNDALAGRNRQWLAERGVFMLNLVSAPGAGKTTLLERTIRDLKGRLSIWVIEGDQATANDGRRIKNAGAPVVQVNTGTGCHLEADMIAQGLAELNPPAGSIVLVENVGNLVCPALFDLGEAGKVAILSVAEGDDKPAKYPHMFAAAKLVLINKIDLLPYVDFRVDDAIARARAVNPSIEAITVSARSEKGLDTWYEWLLEQSRNSARRPELKSGPRLERTVRHRADGT